MKKLRILFAAWLLCGFVVSFASAHQDQSFTSRATAGMFEDMYDLFKYSPAYMPSFEKNAVWTQLSNLKSMSNRLVSGTAGVDDYFIAAQNDLMGMGRIGLALDFMFSNQPEFSLNYGDSSTHQGFLETTQEQYRDTDNDGIIDSQRETYSRGGAATISNEGDLYLAYGLGGFMGLDLGAAIRGVWDTNTPSYSADNIFFAMYTGDWTMAFDRLATVRDLDTITGQTLYQAEQSATGSWTYGSSDWRLILSARSKDMLGLLPQFDAVLNVAPILYNVGNEYKTEFKQWENRAPSDPGIYQTESMTVSESGCQIGDFPLYYNPYRGKPASGFGVNSNLRVDTDMIAGVHLTGWLGFENIAWNNKDPKYSIKMDGESWETNWVGTPSTLTYERTLASSEYRWTWDGKGGSSEILAKIRAQVPFAGWRLALGLNAKSDNTNYVEKTTINVANSERFDRYNSVNTDDYTETMNVQEKKKTTLDRTTNTFELPVGVIIDVLKNFEIEVGVKHYIVQTAEHITNQILETQVPDTITRYDDGRVIADLSSNHSGLFGSSQMNNTSYVSLERLTHFYYGLGWWPFEQVQIEMYGFSNLKQLSNFYFSVSIYH